MAACLARWRARPTSARREKLAQWSEIERRCNDPVRDALWIGRVGSHIEQRHERKPTLLELRVRHAEARGLQHEAPAPENVEVDGPRAPALSADPPELVLDFEQRVEKRLGLEFR